MRTNVKISIRVPGLLLTLSVVFLLILGFSSCNKDELSAEEVFLEKVGHAWSSSTVKLDNVAVDGAFAGFTITLTKDKKFTTSNGNAPIWPASGTFTLQEATSVPGFNLVRSDGVAVEVQQLTETSLILTFQYESDGGRGTSVSGNYVFELTK